MTTRRSFLSIAVISSLTMMQPKPVFAQSKTRVAFANYSDETSFGTLVLRGVQAAAERMPELDVIFYDNKADAAQAVANARLVVLTKPSVFIEYNTIAISANPQIGRLMKDANIPVISVQSRVPGTALFAVDNKRSGYETGKGLAEAAKKRWPGVSPAVLLIGLPEGGPLFMDRTAAARTGILEILPGVNIDAQSSKDDTNIARQITADFLTRNQNRKCLIWAHQDAMGIAALTAARNAAREADVLISSAGGDFSVVSHELQKPDSAYVGTFAFFPETWGNDLLTMALKLAKGGALPDTVQPSKQLFVNSENVSQYLPH